MKIVLFAAAACGLFLFFGSARAQGVIVPIVCDVRPCRPLPRPIPLPPALPVKSIQIDTKINGQVATTHVDQVFRNDSAYTLEGSYFFPIPETASIVEFAIWENGERLAGEVRSKEEARRIYNDIVRRQRDPGLLEYAGKDLFEASIFPIPPNSDKRLELTYTEVLKADSGTVSYRYPLGTGRNLIQRPLPMEDVIPGPVNVRNSSSLTNATVSGRIEIKGNEELRNIYSPSHSIDIKRNGENQATVSFESKGRDADFQLFYGVSNKDFGLSLLTYREPGKDGYFMLMVSPRDTVSEKELVNKDIVFVLDTSGSMADEGKMDKARKSLLFGIRTLRDGDRFNVVSFSGEEHLMERGLVQADASGKKRGEDFVDRLQPNGGTNINDALIASLKQFDNSDRPKMLVFLTDGLPTVGETGVDRIIANLKNAKKTDVRIFTFGFGYDVNTTLLDRIGSENSGMSDYVQPKEDLEVKVSNFFRKVSSPVLSGIDLDMGPVLTDYVYPRHLTDVFRGGQVVVIGRYRNTNDLRDVTLRLTGKNGGETRSFDFRDLAFPVRSDQNDFLPRLWASRRVGWLIEQIRANGETKEVRDEIVDLGTRYGLVTPYTSYLATDGSERIAQPMDVRGLSSLKVTSGAGAVQMSKRQNAMKEATVLDGTDEDRTTLRDDAQKQFIANKSFVNQGGTWVDVEFKNDDRLPVVDLKFGSDEFFKTLSDQPGLAPYLSLGKSVTVVWRGRVYKVTE